MDAPAQHLPAVVRRSHGETRQCLCAGGRQHAHLADELDVLSLDVLHHHDLHLIEEMQGEVAQRVSAVEEQGERDPQACTCPGSARLPTAGWTSG